MMRHLFLVSAVLAALTGTAQAGTREDVAARATAFFNAHNSHDLETVSSMLVKADDFLLIRGPSVTWGTDAVVKQYEEAFKGVWTLRTDGKPPKVIVDSDTTAEVFVPVNFKVGPKEGSTKEFAMNVTQIWIKDGESWKIRSIFATPVAAK